ncbi:MAG: molybdopterin-dependent oxidoreductase [Candidatus Bathyarchaeia archaeon]
MAYTSCPPTGGPKTKNKTIPTPLILITLPLLLIATVQTATATPWDIQLTDATGTTTINLTYANLTALPQTTVFADLRCYGAPVTSGNWVGVQLSEILNQVGYDSNVGSVDFRAQDGYKASLPLDTALQPDVIIAYEKDGVLLGETYRLVVPTANGNVWISMINSISLSTISLDSSVSSNSMPPTEPSWITPQLDQSTPQPTTTPTPQTPTPSPSAVPTETPQPTPSPTDAAQNPSSQLNNPATLSYPYATIVAVALVVAVFAAVAGLVVYQRRKSSA